MARHPGATSTRALIVSVILLAAGGALADPKKKAMDGMGGCTPQQIAAPEGKACQALLDKDVIANRKDNHALKCDKDGMRCCVQTERGSWRDCGPVLLAAQPKAVPPKPAPPPKAQPAAAVACGSLKAKPGVWKSMSVAYRPAEKKCTVTYHCQAPPGDKLTDDEKKCATVVSTAKPVPREGVCAAQKDPCTACNTAPPTDPCVISFANR